jgi:surface polysaccharide O-acyltransferase-like enzyme
MATPLLLKNSPKSYPRASHSMSKFLSYIHNLRGIAILFIVGVHARGYEWNWQSENTHNFFVTVFDNGTVLFVFIAGFLFQHLTHERFNFQHYLKQKINVVVIPYILISIPIIILRLLQGVKELPLGEGFHQHSVAYKIVYFLITGVHMAPFWFMPMIFLFYLSAPLFRKLDNKRFYSSIFILIFLAGMFTYRPAHNANPLLAYIHFVPIYLTGMWASFYKEKIFAMRNKLLLPLLALYVMITFFELSELFTMGKKLSFEEVINGGHILFNVYVLKAVILCFILLIILYNLRNHSMPVIELLGNYSFGIYFIHYYFISALRTGFQLAHVEFKFTALSFIAFYSIVIILSVCAIYCIKKLTGTRSRYFIGS